MNVDLKGVHYNISDRTKEHIDKKLEKLSFVEDSIVDLHITVTKEKNGYSVDSNVHFKWGEYAHLHTNERELYKAIDLLIEKIETKAARSKEKIKDHKGEKLEIEPEPEPVEVE